MSEIVIARYLGSRHVTRDGENRKYLFFEGVIHATDEERNETVQRLKRLRVCARHPKLLRYDGKKCPCCQLLREIPPRTRAKVFGLGRRKIDKEAVWR